MTAQKPQFYYAPDEICVVVSLDPAPDVMVEWGRNVYEPVLTFVNERLARLLEVRAAADDDGPLEADFAPTLARDRFAAQRERVLLQPLSRARVDLSGSAGSLTPWVTLRRQNRSTTALHFYRVGPGQTTRDSWSPDGARIVRELTNLINRNLRQERIAGVPGAIIAATPNWLFPAASNGSGYTGGGPANKPPPVPPDAVPSDAVEPFRFQFVNADLQALVTRQRSAPMPSSQEQPPSQEQQQVVVAILDTCPEEGDVKTMAGDLGNWLLTDVAREVAIDAPKFLPPGYFAFLQPIGPGDGGDGANPYSHDIRDHGLFSAGIIRDIAPTAKIHLIRVLDDTGVGDLLLLTSVLGKLPSRLAPCGQKLVINLSLMACVPLNADQPRVWFPAAAARPDTMLQLWSEMSATFETIHRSLAEVIAWLEEQRVLVVAAAGNDATRFPSRPEPRYPARYDTVLGVAAVNSALAPSAFSNQGDYIQLGNGVAIFGGDLVGQQTVGIFSQPEFPFVRPGSSPNETGWAYWSGTSFATPVVSAIAADVWTESPGLTPAELIVIVTRPIGTIGALPNDPPNVFGRFVSRHDHENALLSFAIRAWQSPR